MIEYVKLRNFKCFRDQTVPFGGLTVLAGLNGSGKSSVIQAILALRQYWVAGQISPWRGDLVNLGSFRDILHDDASDDAFAVELSFGDDRYVYFLQRPPAGLDRGGQATSSGEAEAQLAADLFYVSADRFGPRPTLPFAEEEHASATPLGKRGEHVLWYLDRFGGAAVVEAVRHPSESKHALAAQTNAWLGTISPGAELKIAVVPEADCAVGTYLFSRPADVPSRPFRAGNVGFGVSYVLPSIVALLAPMQGASHYVDHLVIIENPEAHLHPGGQTALAELSARAVAGGSQVILETHSDHVLDGVRLAVRDGVLSPDQVVIHYFEREGLDVRVTSPTVSPSGRLDVWPEGFFDQHERNLSRLIAPPNVGGSAR